MFKQMQNRSTASRSLAPFWPNSKQNELSDCGIYQLSHAVPGISKGRQVLKQFWT